MTPKKLLLLAAVTVKLAAALSAKTGYSQCMDILTGLIKKGFSPETQQIVTSGGNSFPFNIILRFPEKPADGERNSGEERRGNLIISFPSDDAERFPQTVYDTAAFLDSAELNFSAAIVITHGDSPPVKKRGLVSGTDAFINSLNPEDGYAVLRTEMQADRAMILTGTGSESAPSAMVGALFEAAAAGGIRLPFYYIGLTRDYTPKNGTILEKYFSAGIPAVQMNFPGTEPAVISAAPIIKFIEAYDPSAAALWDRHTMILNIAGRSLRMTESAITRTVTALLSASILLISSLGFINSSLSYRSWKSISHIWYALPLSFILCMATFTAGEKILSADVFRHIRTPQTLILMQLSLMLTAVSMLCRAKIISAQKNLYSAKSIDFLIMISTFTNQFLFCLMDMTVFPVFMAVFILSIISLAARKNLTHGIITLLMVAPMIQLLGIFISGRTQGELLGLMMGNPVYITAASLVMTPVCLMWFRIMKDCSDRLVRRGILDGGKRLTLLAGAAIAAVQAAAVLAGRLTAEDGTSSTPYMILPGSGTPEVTFSDSTVLGEKVRTLNIRTGKNPVLCDVSVSAAEGNPVLYSGNDADIFGECTSVFRIPLYPPESMTFVYGTSESGSEITVTALYESGVPGQLLMDRITVRTEEPK